MVALIRLDTHVVVWLYAGEVERLSEAALRLLESEEPVISPIVDLELSYLLEVGRLTVGGPAIVDDLRERIGLRNSEQPMAAVVAAATGLGWTRDPFDRLIVGDALSAATPLLTADQTIRAHTDVATW